MTAFAPNPSASWASHLSERFWASPFGRRLANRSGLIEFVFLRTTSSPPVAPHPASRRRSYSQLQAGVGKPGRDFHPSSQTPSRTHDRGPEPDRAADARAAQPAIAAGILGEVLLVIVLGVIERRSVQDLRGDRTHAVLCQLTLEDGAR